MPILRASIAALVMSLGVIVLGIPVLLIGLIRPWRGLMDRAALMWSRSILFCCGIRLTVEGEGAIADGAPRFFMGNHQSALDIPILMVALRGHVRFMAKDTLFRIPIFGWVLWRYGFAPIDRSSARNTLRTLDRMLERLRRDPVSMAVFPEGTRTRDGRLLPFRGGTMKVAQRSGLAVAPFSIDGSIHVHHRDRFEAHPGEVKLTFARPIPAEEAFTLSTTALRDRVVSIIAEQLGLPPADAQTQEALPAGVEGA